MKIAVLGNDIFAFVAAYIFRQNGFQVLIFDNLKDDKGIIPDFVYVRNTPDAAALLKSLDVLYSVYIVRGGVMLHEKVHPFPKCFREFEKERVWRIRYDYYRKTRKIVVNNPAKAMLRPITTRTKTAIRADLKELCDKLVGGTRVVKRKITRVSNEFVEISNKQQIYFDKLVVTCPLWELSSVVDWSIPEVLAMRSHVARIVAKGDVYGKYDYFYTPYTPANCVHFVLNDGEFFFAEMSGNFDRLALESDLNFLFKRGWYFSKIYKDLKGYTLPLGGPIRWPENVTPVSPYSLWTDHLSFDDTLHEAKNLVKKWTLEK